MKIVFLDIDGVLNSQEAIEKALEDGTLNDLRVVFPHHVNVLKKILMETGAKIVISSTWRHAFKNGHENESMFNETWADILGEDIASRIIGMTPVLDDIDAIRGDEIDAWLSENAFVGEFCIIDDDDDMGNLKQHLVQTDGVHGLEEKHVSQVKKILGVA